MPVQSLPQPHRRVGQKRTSASVAYERLRHDIVHGVLKPGERLRVGQLVERYGFGMSTLREALSRLVGDHLAVSEDQRGFSVAMVSRDGLTDLLAVRLLLEERALRLSIEHGDVDWEVGVMSAFHRLSKVGEGSGRDPRLGDEEWECRHAEFHHALVAACPSPILLRFREAVHVQGERYRRLYLKYLGKERDHLTEHRFIMEAALRRDSEEAVRLLREHLERTVQDLLGSELSNVARQSSGGTPPAAERAAPEKP